MLCAADLHQLRLAHETANMIISAEMKLKASLMRKESRCSHYRLDYPDIDTKNWNAWINIFQGSNGEMKFEKQNFDRWPVWSFDQPSLENKLLRLNKTIPKYSIFRDR